MLEIEAKVRVEDLEALRAKLLGMGAVILQERHAELNTMYDFRSGELVRRKEGLRLRTRGRKATLTFKGAPHRSRRFKVRREYESEVKKAGQVRKILKALGLVPVFGYAKHRTVLKLERVRLCLDETAAGGFLELEGERNRITSLLKRLGIPARMMLKTDYVALLKRD